MNKQNVRVILASEHLEARSFLKDILAEEQQSEVVGEAHNAVEALRLAKILRPDVAIIDSELPHNVGLDGLDLSRIGGLDAGQAICEYIPNIRVVLVNGHATQELRTRTLQDGTNTTFCHDTGEASIPFKIGDLQEAFPAEKSMVFARVATVVKTATRRMTIVNKIADQALFAGAVGFLGGWFFIIMWLAPFGLVLVMIGTAALILGGLGKLATKLVKKFGRTS
jgi:DNA-binding NarL/FixJ family response regulator